MPGTSLVVVGPSRTHEPRARRLILVALAIGGWAAFLLLAAFVLTAKPSSRGIGNAAAPTGVVHLLVGPVMVAEPWVQTALPIQVGPANALPSGGWIRIAGVPALASLSAGHTIGRGVWKVPLAALSTLTIMAPTRESVGSELHIALMSVDGVALAEVRSVLAVMPAALCGAGQGYAASAKPDDLPPGSAYQPSSGRPLPVLTSDEDRQKAQGLALRGEIYRMQGQVESARGYYERAANMGWPYAAVALAATFDPYEVAGTVRPNRDRARDWYARARDLMNAAVEYHLKRLEQPKGGQLLLLLFASPSPT